MADVQGALEASGLDPDCLVLEITDSALVVEMSEVLRILAELKLLGVIVAVDDFGPGPRPILPRAPGTVPVDLLKIDRSFFGDRSDASRLRLLQGTVELGRRLGLWAVAEGVETEQQGAMLPCMSGVFVHGFLYSRPVKVDAVHALLDAHATAQTAAGPVTYATKCSGEVHQPPVAWSTAASLGPPHAGPRLLARPVALAGAD